MNKNKKDIKQVNVRNIKLTKKSKSALKKIKEPLFGNVAYAIESGNWWVPSDTYEYLDIMVDMEKSMYEFYDIPKDAIVEIETFDSDILSFEKGHSREDLNKKED